MGLSNDFAASMTSPLPTSNAPHTDCSDARNARSKAEQLARALDVQVGAVHTIREQQFSFPRALQMGQGRAAMMAESASDANPEAYAAGTIEVEARVSVVFMLMP